MTATLALATVTPLVPNYDEGIDFFVGTLGFQLVEDTDLGDGKRWVVVLPGKDAALLLAKASDESQRVAIGQQTAGRVGFFLKTDNFADTHARFTAAGVTFLEEARAEPYGTVSVFSDPFGNRWDLIEPKAPV